MSEKASFFDIEPEAENEIVVENEILNEVVNAIKSEIENENEVQTQGTLPEQFECVVDVIGEISKSNGLEETWSKTEPLLRDRISKWKQCQYAGNKFLIIL